MAQHGIDDGQCGGTNGHRQRDSKYSSAIHRNFDSWKLADIGFEQ